MSRGAEIEWAELGGPFDGVPAEELARALEHRRFRAGATLLLQGDHPEQIYLLHAGVADVVSVDTLGMERHLRRIGPGDTVGVLSFVTGRPAAATVRAVTDLEVLVMSRPDFQELAAAYPRVYRNLAAILSERLAGMQGRLVEREPCRVHMLLDAGAPPRLAYALACSLAWHTRRPTLLLVISDRPPPESLVRLATSTAGPEALFREPVLGWRPGSRSRGANGNGGSGDGRPSLRAVYAREARAQLILAPPEGVFAPGALAVTLRDLCDLYDRVLVHVPTGSPPLPVEAQRIGLASARGTLPADLLAGDDSASYAVRAWGAEGTRPRPDREGVLWVPALTPADEQGLEEGRLAPTSGAGRALGWAARDLAGMKVGLALGAGSERGYAHVGVLSALDRAGLPVDYLVGTSIGAGVAAGYAHGFSPNRIAQLLDEISASMFRPAVPLASLLSNFALRTHLRRIVGHARIEEMPRPLAIVAADIESRREVVFQSGELLPALIASMAIPGIYPAQRMGGYTLVDGGVLNPVPCNVAAEMGADVVIGVRLQVPPNPRALGVHAEEPAGRPPSALQVLGRSIEMTQSTIATQAAARATILIEPVLADLGGWGVRDFRRGRIYMEHGEAAAEAALAQIAAALPWLEN